MTQVNITCDNCGRKIIDTILSTDSIYDSLLQHTHDVMLQMPDYKGPLGINNILVEYEPQLSHSLRTQYVNFCCLECFKTWYEEWGT